MTITEMKHHVAHVTYDVTYADTIRQGAPHRDACTVASRAALATLDTFDTHQEAS